VNTILATERAAWATASLPGAAQTTSWLHDCAAADAPRLEEVRRRPVEVRGRIDRDANTHGIRDGRDPDLHDLRVALR
jgi:hypothetical protein